MSSPSPMSVSRHPHSGPRADLHGRLGFNGQFHEPGECRQFLGNGYRIFNPVLMRFHSPDSLSPFDKGGINAYAYCVSDPVNRLDPNGHWSFAAFAASLATYKLKTTLVTPVLVATAASLGAVGLAVASKNDTQRGLAIVGAVIAAAGAFMGGRYAFRKAAQRGAAAAAARPAARRPSTLSTLNTNSTRSMPLSTAPTSAMPSPTSPASRTTPPPPSRPAELHIPGRSRQRMGVSRPTVAPPPPPPLPLSADLTSNGRPVAMRVAGIRRPSATWEESSQFTEL